MEHTNITFSKTHIYLNIESDEFSCTEFSISVFASINTQSPLVANSSATQPINDTTIKKQYFTTQMTCHVHLDSAAQRL